MFVGSIYAAVIAFLRCVLFNFKGHLLQFSRCSTSFLVRQQGSQEVPVFISSGEIVTALKMDYYAQRFFHDQDILNGHQLPEMWGLPFPPPCPSRLRDPVRLRPSAHWGNAFSGNVCTTHLPYRSRSRFYDGFGPRGQCFRPTPSPYPTPSDPRPCHTDTNAEDAWSSMADVGVDTIYPDSVEEV